MIRSIARVAVEFTTPFLIGAGRGDARADEVFVADANGLPGLPGTSIAGALREAYDSIAPHDNLPSADALFGFQARGARVSESRGSAIRFSWGALHNQHDCPVEGLLAPTSDPILALARAGVHRHHVRLSRRGVAEGTCKFDVDQVAVGHRFTFEIAVDDDGRNGDSLTRGFDAILSMLARGEVSLGSGRGTGLGRFKTIRVHRGRFDLSSPAGFRALASLEPELAWISTRGERPNTQA